jgi:histidyl-tRNA synthetase
MRDLLPREGELRDQATSIILETYRKYGFVRVETPAMENIENLTGGEGGENEKLVFKVLKRGEKLSSSQAGAGGAELADLGLRFDLTVPLARYYAGNFSALPNPLKAVQIGPVWRAERPQKGRYRQFTQCDIDIIGMEAPIAEVELLLATSDALLALGFSNFHIRINDRRVLQSLAEHCGFRPEAFNSVFITLDKIDKIGLEGVRKELIENGQDGGAVGKLLDLLSQMSAEQTFEQKRTLLPAPVDGTVYDALQTVIDTVRAQADGRFGILFDPLLVRGMSYYTGQIFEIASPEFPSSLAGGGRYDKMIGKFLGREVPACGFSIGFERVISILEAKNPAPTDHKKLALLFEKSDALPAVVTMARKRRDAGYTVSLQMKRPKLRKQLDELALQGFSLFSIFDGSDEPAIKALESPSDSK